MKKKIKDLTMKEVYKICSKYSCKDCPLDVPKLWCKFHNLEQYGDEEVEVEDSE